ncbi:MAG: peptidoglycan-binding protein [Oceanicaulis sp.]
MVRVTQVSNAAAGVKAGLAALCLPVLLAGCDLIEQRGEQVYEACLYDTRYSHSSLDCRCYVDQVQEALDREDWRRYRDMAGQGFYSNSDRLRTSFHDERMGVFEQAARRCNLDLFQPEEDIVAPTPGYGPGYGDRDPLYGGRDDWWRPEPTREPAFGGWGRGGDRFPRGPWRYAIREGEPRPICIRGRGIGEGCMTREQAARLYNDGARYWLLRGDAELATVDLQRGTDWVDLPFAQQGDDARAIDDLDYDRGFVRYDASSVRRAMRYWNYSIDWGRPFGAQSALMAQRRLQAHMVQCESSPDGESLSRISRRGPEELGDVISLKLRQAALAALGYYSAEVDGRYGPATRDAVRGFQRELGYDETGSLSPRQTTLLVCHAAQTARDPHLQNALGIMYATGLGVARNPDLSLEWFETAARRDDADAYFNLALVYGTGAVLGSYRLCGLIENPERADAYLRDAAALGHPVAMRWRDHREFWDHPTAESRWIAISNRLEEAAAEGSGAFYLEWRSQIDVDRFSPTELACLEPERGTRREPL